MWVVYIVSGIMVAAIAFVVWTLAKRKRGARKPNQSMYAEQAHRIKMGPKWYDLLGFVILECIAIVGALPIFPIGKVWYKGSSLLNIPGEWGTVQSELWGNIPIFIGFLVLAGILTFFIQRKKSLKTQVLSIIIVVDTLFLTGWGIMTFH